MDKLCLIAEVRKRPYLWQSLNTRSRHKTADLWEEVAKAVGADVKSCKSKWTQLRGGYSKEEQRYRKRIEWVVKNKNYDPNKNYSSKWIYFENLKFLSSITENNKFDKNDSDQGSNFSNTENIDEDFEIELVIEDGSDHSNISEWDDVTEKNVSQNISDNTPTSSKNRSLLRDADSSKQKIDYLPILRDNKSLQQNTQIKNIDQIGIKAEQPPVFQLIRQCAPKSHSANVSLLKKSLNTDHNQITSSNERPKSNSANVSLLKRNINTEQNQITSSNERPHNVILMSSTITSNVNRNMDDGKNKSCGTNDNKSLTNNAELLNVCKIFIKQEPPDIETNADIVDSQISNEIHDKQNRTENSLQLPSVSMSSEKIILPSIISSTNEMENNNSSCTKTVTFSNMDVIPIKEEPVETEESNKIQENTNIRPDSNKPDNKHSEEQFLNLPSPKRIRLRPADTPNPTLISTYRNQTPLNNETPTSSRSFRALEDQNSFTNLREDSIYSKGSIDIGDLDCNFLVSFFSHMKAMSQFQNLKFRAEISNLMLSILSTRETTEREPINNLEKAEQNSLLKAVVDIGDADCNFLVSFLPHLKSMSRLQNLQFRAKMSDLMLNIFCTSVFSNNVSDSTSSG